MNRDYQDEYNKQLKKLKKICSKLDKAPNYLSLSQEYGLRSSRWFIIHCENKNVKDYNSFMEYEVGIKPNYMMSEDGISNLIYSFMEKYGRSPRRKDFDNRKILMSTGTIQRLFGSIRKMRIKLGIPSSGTVGGMERKKTTEEIKIFIKKFLKEKKEKIFSIEEINNFFVNNNMDITYQTISKRFRESENISIREYFLKLGFEVVKPGMGLNYVFDDGEKTYSYHEKIFSKILRENGFIFNSSYFRDVKYSKLFNGVQNNYTLDYFILFGKRKIHIEVAGILRDHKKHYLENKKITKSKSKEKYRISLLEKEKIMRNNGVEYYIIFPNKYKKLEKIVYENLTFLKRGDI